MKPITALLISVVLLLALALLGCGEKKTIWLPRSSSHIHKVINEKMDLYEWIYSNEITVAGICAAMSDNRQTHYEPGQPPWNLIFVIPGKGLYERNFATRTEAEALGETKCPSENRAWPTIHETKPW